MKRKVLYRTFSDDHWLYHSINVNKLSFNSYIYTLLLDCLCVLFVKFRRKLFETCGAEVLVINAFSYDV